MKRRAFLVSIAAALGLSAVKPAKARARLSINRMPQFQETWWTYPRTWSVNNWGAAGWRASDKIRFVRGEWGVIRGTDYVTRHGH